TTCGADTCPQPPPTGACCFSNSLGGVSCTVTSQSTCVNQLHGTYRGDGTACNNDTCPQPTGACCVTGADGAVTCVVTTQADCAFRHGVYRGNGSTCGSDT